MVITVTMSKITLNSKECIQDDTSKAHQISSLTLTLNFGFYKQTSSLSFSLMLKISEGSGKRSRGKNKIFIYGALS